MTKNEFLEYCRTVYGAEPDYPFEKDFETAVLRHKENRKWYAIVMRVPRFKFKIQSDEVTDVVNLKLPIEMFGSFGEGDGVYPAYHMNKRHWISVILSDVSDDLLQLLLSASYEATGDRKKYKKAAANG